MHKIFTHAGAANDSERSSSMHVTLSIWRREMIPGFNKKNGIQGVIIPVKKDDSGNVIAVGIRTVNEQEFLVELNRNGQELNRHVFEAVIVHGTFRERLDGKTLIRVINYQVLSERDKP